jgi:hypothetical protein
MGALLGSAPINALAWSKQDGTLVLVGWSWCPGGGVVVGLMLEGSEKLPP